MNSSELIYITKIMNKKHDVIIFKHKYQFNHNVCMINVDSV